MTEPEVRWGYLGAHAVCSVTLGGRTESWESESIYVFDKERLGVPRELEAKLRRTIRMFGPIIEDD